MAKRINYGKAFIVVFLTALIWVWADLAQDEELPWSNVVSVNITRPTDETLWVSFGVDPSEARSSVIIESVDLKGPASRVTDVERLRNRGVLDLDLFLTPAQEGFTEPGTRTFDVLNFLKQNNEIQQLGLTVENCEPRTLTVQIRRLEAKSLAVECVNESGTPLHAEIEPSVVEAFVPPEELPTARVILTQAEQNQARNNAVEKMPYVEFLGGQRRAVSTPVSIRLVSDTVTQTPERVQATLGFCFSHNSQGRYSVELQNDTELAYVSIRATSAARQAYLDQSFQILLYILDSDRPGTDFQERAVVFNFPEEYVERGEIAQGEATAPVARFRLVPVDGETTDTLP
jgi:hypothetical protein